MESETLIHVVDDDPSFRAAIVRLLEAKGYTVKSYVSAEEFLTMPIKGRGCVLLDVRMPGLSGLQLQEVWQNQPDVLPLIFVTGHGDVPMSVRAIKAGAEDFLIKPVPSAQLFAAIEAALVQYDANSKRDGERRSVRSRYERLTPREVEVLQRVLIGRLNKQISAELGIAERTVKAHRHQLMAKFGANSVAQLVGFMKLIDDKS